MLLVQRDLSGKIDISAGLRYSSGCLCIPFSRDATGQIVAVAVAGALAAHGIVDLVHGRIIFSPEFQGGGPSSI